MIGSSRVGTRPVSSYFNHMQIGPDGIIYIPSGKSISIIEFPNLSGIACNYRDSLYTNLIERPGTFSLINPLVSSSPPTITPTQLLPQDTQLCRSQSIFLDVSIPDHQYYWQDSSTNAQYTISAPSTYWVNVRKGNCTLTDTLVVLPDYSNFELGPDTTLCSQQTLELSLEDKPELAFLWKDGSTSPHFSIKQPGTYSLQTTHDLCSHSDSINVVFENIPPALPKDTILCTDDSLSIDLSHFKGKHSMARWQHQPPNNNQATWTIFRPAHY